MNWQHLQAFVWLRWRLLANQWRRGGTVNAVLMLVVAVSIIGLAVPLFVACFVAGVYLLPRAQPAHLLYVWDAIIVAFVFFWSIGLLTELQRTETLSLSKFLHLPVSIKGAFFINFLSSLLRLSLVLFAPIMFGLAAALAFAKGGALVLALPLTIAFLLMVTAVTYQFQGWLASLMTNPRRRRTVVVGATALFILVFQLPQLLNIYQPWRGRAQASNRLVDEFAELDRKFKAGEFDSQEHVRRQEAAKQRHDAANTKEAHDLAESAKRTVHIVNWALPIGWLPAGTMSAAEGNVGWSLLALGGMSGIATASLWRAYRTTLRLYQGDFTAGKAQPVPAAIAKPAKIQPRGKSMVEAELPWLSEPVSAIALAGLRSTIRAPEAKMMLLTPVLMAGIFGAIVLRHGEDIPVAFRPLMGVGATSMVLFGVLQLMCNQFGFDRDGFRVFVLCAASRRDILLGKNLSFAPLAFGLMAVLLIILQIVCPMRWDCFLAMPGLAVATFLPFCLLMNVLSILAPIPIPAGSMKPANVKLSTVMVQMAIFMFVFPLTQLPMALPLAVEGTLAYMGWTTYVPVMFLLSLLECAGIVFIYRAVLNWQGELLQSREQKILETVTNRTP